MTSWSVTKKLWSKHFPEIGSLNKKTAGYRGEPPVWFFETNPKNIIKIVKNINTSGILEKIGDLNKIEKDLKSGDKKNYQFEVEVEKEICEDISEKIGGKIIKNLVPGRACTTNVPFHKDRYHGDGDLVENWVYLLYVKGEGKMIFRDDFSGEKFEVEVEAGTMVCFPNDRFSHAYERKNKNEMRVMLGPMTADSSDKSVVYSGGCGGCGGGCGWWPEDCPENEWETDPDTYEYFWEKETVTKQMVEEAVKNNTDPEKAVMVIPVEGQEIEKKMRRKDFTEEEMKTQRQGRVVSCMIFTPIVVIQIIGLICYVIYKLSQGEIPFADSDYNDYDYGENYGDSDQIDCSQGGPNC